MLTGMSAFLEKYSNDNDFYSLSEIDWDFTDSDNSAGINSIHPYPAKFIPEIPRALLNCLTIPTNTSVLDPFCGSGVTLVEAKNSGFNSIGIDLNPIACLISRVKTRPLPEKLDLVANSIVHDARKSQNVILPNIPNLDHWFKHDIQLALASLVSEINKIDELDLREALQCALSNIIVKVSNQDSDTRYAAVQKNVKEENVYTFFLQAVSKLKYLDTNLPNRPLTTVINDNILNITADTIKEPIGIVITSPPYPNAYEYWLYHKYRMFWLGYDPIKVRKDEIGARAHYFKKNHQTPEDFSKQLHKVFKLLDSVVVSNGYAVFVTGRSKIHGEIINNDQMIIEAAENNNFELFKCIIRKMNPARKSFNLSHARIKNEYIVILKHR
jgi:site-specific DNA-methyltransferase (cytosine-N4-specific)